MEGLTILLSPFFLLLLCLATHAYFGLHVIRRGIIFIDLALAQLVGLSSVLLIGFVHGEESPYHAVPLSLFIIAVISAYFAAIQKIRPKDQEALIGVVYVTAAATTILVLANFAHGDEHLKNMLMGNLLWVEWKEVGILALFYIPVMLFHYLFRERFFDVSNGVKEKQYGGLLWNFLFYLTFGWIITFSVPRIGVLLVFSILIMPSLISIWAKQGFRNQYLFSVLIGAVFSSLGMLISYFMDLPSGACVVCVMGVFVILLSLVYKKEKR